MAPKTNAKKESGRAKKAENEAKKKEVVAATKEKKEEDDWAGGSKSNKAKEEKEEKKRAEAARKAENARLLAEEEAAAAAKPKAAPKAGKKKEVKPAGPGAIAAGGLASTSGTGTPKSPERAFEEVIPPESFSATGIDDALELLSIVGAKTDNASVGQAAAGIEQHPERRFKAAFEAYQERELPNFKIEHPGLRLHQYKELLYKKFQKSPDNPFNQTTVSYDASKQEKVAALKQKHALVEERLRDQT